LAEYVGFGITPHQISLGNGSDEIIRSLLIVTGLQRGSILVAEPTFSMYEILAKNLGISVVKVPRRDRDFEINLDAARQAIATHQIAAVFLVHPNSPTGNLLTDAELDWARSLPEHILVVLDEAYFEFSGHTLVPELAAHPNWVILRTFSKALRLAAYRVGYGIAHPELIAALEKVRLPYNLPTISYEAAILAISHRQELLAAIPEILTERDRLYTAIRAMGISVWASAANFLYLRTEHDHDVMQCLKQQGTAIRQTGGGLRITIGTPAQNQRTLDRLQTCLSR
jgi:histidinol-phosphate aminotransferase